MVMVSWAISPTSHFYFLSNLFLETSDTSLTFVYVAPPGLSTKADESAPETKVEVERDGDISTTSEISDCDYQAELNELSLAATSVDADSDNLNSM